MVFSTNQARQLYVANALTTVNESAEKGAFAVHADKAKTHLYFNMKGADNVLRSDLINIKDIISVTAVDAKTMAQPLKSVKVTLDSSVNGGAVVAGEDYILKLFVRQYQCPDDGTTLYKNGAVHGVKGMSASDFYKTLALSLAKNFARDEQELFDFALISASGNDAVTPKTKAESLSKGNYTGITITEHPQPWVLGTLELVPVYFEVATDEIMVDKEEYTWGKVTEVDSKKVITNGHKMADLEYFCMGERGDIYRNIGWPNVIKTHYLVDPDTQYNVIDIHYAFVGANEGPQKSEKTLTILVPKVGSKDSESNVLANSVISAINTATGLNIAKLNVLEA